MRSETRPIVKSCAAIALLWLAGLGTASAIVIRGSVDPIFDFGGSFGNIDWTATIQFSDADASCVSGLNATDPVGHPCLFDPGTLSVTGTLTDSSSDNAPLTFATSDSTPVSIRTSAGITTAIDTPALSLPAGTFFTLGSIHGFATVDFSFGSGGDGPASIATMTLQQCSLSSDDYSYSLDRWTTAACTPFGAPSTSAAASVTVSQTPEPGVLWLALTAVAGVWLVRRRTSR
jgi:MYXO-CTERM domain-containing protein